MKTKTITLSIIGFLFATACASPPPQDQSGVKVNNAGLAARMNHATPAAEAPAQDAPAAEASAQEAPAQESPTE